MGGKKASSPMAILCPFQDENPLLSNGLQSFLIFCHFTFPMAFSSSTNIIHLPISISPSNSSSNSNNYNSAASLYTRRCPPPAAKHQRYLCVKCNGSNKSWVPGKDDNDNDKTLKRVHKLYEVIKNKNMNQVYEVIADELPDAYNSIPAIRVFRAILPVLEFFSHISKTFVNSLKFTAKPTTKNGSMAGVKWKLGWQRTLMTLGKGIDIQSHHIYVGKLLIGNMERIMDASVQQKPIEEKDLNLEPPKKRRAAPLYLGFFFFVLSLFFFQFSVR
ncbi:uncharacterized protein LOC111781941 isoform X2 [Cucurbita pepo subsp. pepo]|uniref:uncharacterized protein LOC111781941 isoform X2 n=1 Tax=Cucurbita pepo subsp. pepo TaxID=3664 RepID=UPI000C9D6489|nr:uncharacterized protein LOC111781941 isoform X2 [Cucurbita pepo subsp. pepo]